MTEEGVVQGVNELYSKKDIKYTYDYLKIISFFGGDNRGRCIQLSSGHNKFHIQLEEHEAKQLAKLINQVYEEF
jgi:hypothetical protein